MYGLFTPTGLRDCSCFVLFIIVITLCCFVFGMTHVAVVGNSVVSLTTQLFH